MQSGENSRNKLQAFRVIVLDKDGNPLLEVHDTATFADEMGKTKLNLKAVVVRSAPGTEMALPAMEARWTQSLERLDEFVGRG